MPQTTSISSLNNEDISIEIVDHFDQSDKERKRIKEKLDQLLIDKINGIFAAHSSSSRSSHKPSLGLSEILVIKSLFAQENPEPLKIQDEKSILQDSSGYNLKSCQNLLEINHQGNFFCYQVTDQDDNEDDSCTCDDVCKCVKCQCCCSCRNSRISRNSRNSVHSTTQTITNKNIPFIQKFGETDVSVSTEDILHEPLRKINHLEPLKPIPEEKQSLESLGLGETTSNIDALIKLEKSSEESLTSEGDLELSRHDERISMHSKQITLKEIYKPVQVLNDTGSIKSGSSWVSDQGTKRKNSDTFSKKSGTKKVSDSLLPPLPPIAENLDHDSFADLLIESTSVSSLVSPVSQKKVKRHSPPHSEFPNGSIGSTLKSRSKDASTQVENDFEADLDKTLETFDNQSEDNQNLDQPLTSIRSILEDGSDRKSSCQSTSQRISRASLGSKKVHLNTDLQDLKPIPEISTAKNLESPPKDKTSKKRASQNLGGEVKSTTGPKKLAEEKISVDEPDDHFTTIKKPAPKILTNDETVDQSKTPKKPLPQNLQSDEAETTSKKAEITSKKAENTSKPTRKVPQNLANDTANTFKTSRIPVPQNLGTETYQTFRKPGPQRFGSKELKSGYERTQDKNIAENTQNSFKRVPEIKTSSTNTPRNLTPIKAPTKEKASGPHYPMSSSRDLSQPKYRPLMCHESCPKNCMERSPIRKIPPCPKCPSCKSAPSLPHEPLPCTVQDEERSNITLERSNITLSTKQLLELARYEAKPDAKSCSCWRCQRERGQTLCPNHPNLRCGCIGSQYCFCRASWCRILPNCHHGSHGCNSINRRP